MASLAELVAGVAHEINNPLAYVLSHLGTAESSLKDVQRSARANRRSSRPANELGSGPRPHRRGMRLGLERIRALVLKLRTFSRLDEGEIKSVSIRECVDSVLTILQHRLGDRIQRRPCARRARRDRVHARLAEPGLDEPAHERDRRHRRARQDRASARAPKATRT